MRLYIAGPMRNYPQFNFPEFKRAAWFYRSKGYEVVSPAEHDLETYPDMEKWPGFATGDVAQCPGFDLREALRWDLNALLDCDGIVLLRGWRQSAGAQAEYALAKALGLEVLESKRRTAANAVRTS